MTSLDDLLRQAAERARLDAEGARHPLDRVRLVRLAETLDAQANSISRQVRAA